MAKTLSLFAIKIHRCRKKSFWYKNKIGQLYCATLRMDKTFKRKMWYVVGWKRLNENSDGFYSHTGEYITPSDAIIISRKGKQKIINL